MPVQLKLTNKLKANFMTLVELIVEIWFKKNRHTLAINCNRPRPPKTATNFLAVQIEYIPIK